MSPHSERILIIESTLLQPSGLHRALEAGGYSLFAAATAGQALAVIAQEKVDLMIVDGAQAANSHRMDRAGKNTPLFHTAARARLRAGDCYEICRAVAFDPGNRQIPLLMIVPLWDECALVRSLEAGADNILFSPYQEADLLRSVRSALLNGPSTEPRCVVPGVEVLHRDRLHVVTAGRGRLAKLLFSVFDDLQHTRSATHWSQTEIQQLRNRLDRMRTPTKGSELLKDLGQGMAHDFGNLIDTICTAASVLGAGTSHPAPCLAAMEAATAQARELLAVLQHLAFIEEEGFPAEVVDPGRAVREVLEASLILERAQNIRVRLRLRNLPSIQSNAFVVSRCLSNLVWNAIQALPSGGTLSIVGHVQSDQVVLEISDTGPGISKADQDKIFTPHFSTKSGHSGLGLYLARKLARLAGGDITVASRPGRGSTFAMSFPVAAPERPSVSDTPSEGQRLVPMR